MVLGLVSLLSLGARVAWLGTPKEPVFDESFYVNAARTILGRAVPADSPYQQAPGLDPAVEHPPLAKLAIAGGIEVFGDNPVGWRLPSVAFGSAAIVALYWLVRSAGGSGWLGVGAASVMAADNLFLVHGRIATIDIFTLVFMLGGATLYLRGRPLVAGAVLGLGACTKLVGLFALVVLALFEAMETAGAAGTRRPVLVARARSLAACALVTAVSYLVVLGALDHRYTMYSNPFSHTAEMVSSGAKLPAEPKSAGQGILLARPSSPWKWLTNREPVPYFETVKRAGPGRPARTVVLFQGRMNPFVIFLAVPALLATAWTWWRRRDRVSCLAVAWCLGTFFPFAAVSARGGRSYLYYMLVVLPGVCIAAARFFSRRGMPRVLTGIYGAALVYGVWALYPFRTWGGH